MVGTATVLESGESAKKWAREAAKKLEAKLMPRKLVRKDESKFLAQGTLGNYFEGWIPVPGKKEDREVVIKELEKKPRELLDWSLEALVLAYLGDHANVHSFIAFAPTTKGSDASHILVHEEWGLGPADAYLSSRREKGSLLSLHTLLGILDNAAAGLQHLHDCGILYGGLAASKILLFRLPSGELIAKLWDFGSAIPVAAVAPVPTGGPAAGAWKTSLAEWKRELYAEGTAWRWLAPEVLKERRLSPAADAWSLGIVATEVLNHGSVPYGIVVETPEEWEAGVVGGERPSVETDVPDELNALITAATSLLASKRPSVKEMGAGFRRFRAPLSPLPTDRSEPRTGSEDQEEEDNYANAVPRPSAHK